jgi:hypothetical protein
MLTKPSRNSRQQIEQGHGNGGQAEDTGRVISPNSKQLVTFRTIEWSPHLNFLADEFAITEWTNHLLSLMQDRDAARNEINRGFRIRAMGRPVHGKCHMTITGLGVI